MKPITKITLYYRDAHDPETLTPCGGIDLESIGHLTIILTRNEMGVPMLEAANLKAEPGFDEQIRETRETLKMLHECMAKMHILSNQANTDLFALHKWLEH